MSYTGRDFDPILPNESEPFDFDFANELDTDESILSATWSIAVVTGTDASASSRLSGPVSIIGDRVFQRIENCVGGVFYRLQADAVTDQGNTKTLYSHVRCVSPY